MPLTAIAFLVLFACGCFLAFARHPIYGLLTYVATFYFEPSGQWWGQGALLGVRWELVPAIVTLAAMLVHRTRTASLAFRSSLFWGFATFVVWIAIQSSWALDPASHWILLTIWLKFLIVTFMICGCIESWEHLKMFLWTHVIGCFYLGWLAYTQYTGGRFQGFGIGSLAEANAGALQLVTGLIVASSLFLVSNLRGKAVLLGPLALIADGVVATVSRSGFLAAAVAGVVYNVFTPRQLRKRVRLLSLLAIGLFASLTTASYWQRMQTIELQGADIPGVDTGGGRLEIIHAQWQMFLDHPFGCGHMCTTVLSPNFLASRFLDLGERASHNTFMTMLVDHGILGAVFYVALLWWIFSNVRWLARRARELGPFPAAVLPAIAGVLAAIVIGDMFVQYPRLEARVWFASLLVVYRHLVERETATARQARAPLAEVPRVAANT